MGSHPTPMRRESVLTTILLAPLRAIEQTRGWRRIGLLILYGLIGVAIWAPLRRRSQLAGLPDVGKPFDVAAFQAPDRVADDRNAFVFYRQAVEHFRDMNDAESAAFSRANLEWSRADKLFRGWVRDQDDAISLLCTGAAKPDFVLESPAGTTVQAATMANGTLAARLGWIGTAALFKAGKLQAAGDPAGAWSLLKAVVRASRHVEWATPTAQGRSHGIMMAQYAREPVAGWAKDPSVSVALLRQALDDLAAAESLTPPLSTFYRQEYFGALESLANPQPMIAARAKERHDRPDWHLFAIAPALEAYLDGEPERSRRVLNLLIANDLAWCDRPAADQPPVAVARLCIFEPDPTAPASARALAPDELARWADSSLIAPALTWRLGEIEKCERIDRWSLRALFEAVSVSLFTKETGHSPASPAEALRRYRPAPGDTPDRDESQPLP
jgi:hypothetical protein